MPPRLRIAMAGMLPLPGNLSLKLVLALLLPFSWGPVQAAEAAAGAEAASAEVSVPGLNFTLNKAQPLFLGRDALAARLDIVAHAEHSIDLQYYIYHNDRSGRLLAEALLRAADRGVHVRALVDDIHSDNDEVMEALNAHPDIEIRHFNPFRMRKLRMLETVLAFGRVDRRMHNKQLTVDGRYSIVGGRNIGDEYFSTGDDSAFADLDVLVSGPAVGELEKVFEEYWSSPRSKLLSEDVSEKKKKRLAILREQLLTQLRQDEAPLREAVASSDYLAARRAGQGAQYECPTAVLADKPDDKDGDKSHSEVGEGLAQFLRAARRDVVLISAYFVPGEEGTRALVAALDRQVNVVVVTNSLASTDVGAVHAGYSRYREPLLRAGAKIWEMKPMVVKKERWHFAFGGSSRASLHTKSYLFDQRYLFIGSFNLDPRSAALNTEMGLLFDCPGMAVPLREGLDMVLPDLAYRVYLNEDGKLRWEDNTDETIELHDKEPHTGFWKRSEIWWLKRLPIEGEL